MNMMDMQKELTDGEFGWWRAKVIFPNRERPRSRVRYLPKDFILEFNDHE